MKIFGVLVAFVAVLPSLTARELTLGDYSREARRSVESRLRKALGDMKSDGEVSGTVTFSTDDHFFLQVGDDGLKIMADEVPNLDSPAVGDEVAVGGRPMLEGGRVVLKAKTWRKVGKAPLPPATQADSNSLVYGGDGKSVNWLRVEVEGRAIGITQNGFAIKTSSELPVNVVLADVPPFIRDCERTHPLVRVIGVAELLLDQSALFTRTRYVMGVKINATTPADVTLVPDLVYLSNLKDWRVQLAWGAVIVFLSLVVVTLVVMFYRQRRGLFRAKTITAERKRMADDLHDTIEQHLVGAGMFIKLNRLKEAEEILLRAKREMRDIVWGLKNDEMTRLTPAEMIENYARDENRKNLCQIETHLEGLPAHLEVGAMRDLSLVLRESVGNAIKHGGATHFRIDSDGNGEHWTLRIANDGKPFDPATAPGPSEGHFGVEGMRQRARRFGATISFEQKDDWMVMEVTK